MSQPIASKTLKIIQYFKDHPTADVKKVAAKFKCALPKVYSIRKRAREESWQPPELLPMPPVPEVTAVDTVLDQRAVDYGAFKDGAALMQGIKRLLADHAQKHGKTFADDQWEALEMIVHKMGRIVNGNPDKVDHWTDIAGYAKLVADRLEGRVR
jgi:phosphoribosylanthranilate isomerase